MKAPKIVYHAKYLTDSTSFAPQTVKVRSLRLEQLFTGFRSKLNRTSQQALGKLLNDLVDPRNRSIATGRIAEIIDSPMRVREFNAGMKHLPNGDIFAFEEALSGGAIRQEKPRPDPVSTIIAIGRYACQLRRMLQESNIAGISAVLKNYGDREQHPLLPPRGGIPSCINKNRQAHIIIRTIEDCKHNPVGLLLDAFSELRSHIPNNPDRKAADYLASVASLIIRCISAVNQKGRVGEVFTILIGFLSVKAPLLAEEANLEKQIEARALIELAQEFAGPLYLALSSRAEETAASGMTYKAMLVLEKALIRALATPQCQRVVLGCLYHSPDDLRNLSEPVLDALYYNLGKSGLDENLTNEIDRLSASSWDKLDLPAKRKIAADSSRIRTWIRRLEHMRSMDELPDINREYQALIPLCSEHEAADPWLSIYLGGYLAVQVYSVSSLRTAGLQLLRREFPESILFGAAMQKTSANRADAQLVIDYLKGHGRWEMLIEMLNTKQHADAPRYIHAIIDKAREIARNPASLSVVRDPYSAKVLEEACLEVPLRQEKPIPPLP
jgi:hypothetical protein